MKKKVCLYCGKPIIHGKNYCTDTCKDSYDKFEKNGKNHSKIFVVSVSISLIIAFIGFLLTISNKTLGNIISNMGVLLFFVTLGVLPFATPTTIELFGVKKTKLAVRIVALLLAVWVIISGIF